MRSPAIFLFFILPLLLPYNSSAQSCRNETFSSNILYASCNSLPYLSASLHWTYHPSNGTVDVAYRAPQSSSGWVGWAINPSGEGMIGSNAFLAFHNSSSGALNVWTYQLKSYSPTVQDENLTFTVYSRDAEYSGGAYTIYATVQLPGNLTRQNTAWQSSTLFQGGVPHGHPSGNNQLSKISLDFLSGQTSSNVSNSRLHRERIHGVLNAVSWGILLPVGVMIARYGKVFQVADPAWFYLHITCQFSAYAIGVGGWSLGLKLANESGGSSYPRHRNVGIVIFSLATLQMLALLLRPNKKNKYRLYWNLYHWAVGYTVIVLSVINVFKGLAILDPAKKWRHAYIAVISTLAGVALVLEASTWAVVLKRRRSANQQQEKPGHDGVTGANGYGGRQT